MAKKAAAEQVSTRKLSVEVYRDRLGQPTCALDFEKGRACTFHRVQQFGCGDTCVFAESYGRRSQSLIRYPNTGFLKPLNNCPIWKK